jgi:glycosyltransferase involved in cell wall biosynthesis
LKILHISTFLQGGAGKVVVDLAKGALAKGHEVTIACTKQSVDGYGNYPEHIKNLKDLKVPLVFLNSTFSRDQKKNLQAAETLQSQIVQNCPDLIHSHSSIPSLVAMKATSGIEKKIPIIQTMHGWGIYKTEEQEAQDISILERVDHVVSISKSSENLLTRKGLTNTNRSVIFNGLPSVPDIETDPNDEHVLLIKSLQQEGKKIIGVVGTVDSRKNQSLVMDALLLVPHKIKINAFFIGEGEDLESYRKKAEKLGISDRVTFTGYKAAARSFIGKFDLLVNPSLSEGAAPLAILEAFADKTLVLASDTPENKEAVEDSRNGFLFRSGDAENLCEKIQQSLKCENKKEILDSAHKLFSNRFSGKQTLQNYLELYERLINQGH